MRIAISVIGMIICIGIVAIVVDRKNSISDDPTECSPEAVSFMRLINVGASLSEVVGRLQERRLSYVVNEKEAARPTQAHNVHGSELIITFLDAKKWGLVVQRRSQVVVYFDSSDYVLRRECNVVFRGP